MEAASVAVRRKQKRPSGFSEGRLGAAMMAPSLVVMALVAAFPIGYAVWLSLNEYSVRQEGLSRFVGFDNYADELWGENSSQFWDAFVNTFIFTGISVSIELVLGTAFALAMHQAFRGRALLRATVLVPWAVLTFGTGLLFRTLDALRIFDLPFALTQGSNGTTTLSLYAYNELTDNRLVGEGSAIAVLTFVIVMVVAFLYIRFVGGNIRAMTEEA